MKALRITLVIILSCVFGFSSCSRQGEFADSSESSDTSEIISYDHVLNNDEVKTLLKSVIQPDTVIKVCSPVYFMQFDFEKMSVSQSGLLMPFDTVIFPVLEDKKIAGFIMYQYQGEEICGAPRFMPISDKAYNKLKKKHTLKIALAQWKELGDRYLDYVYFSDDNEAYYLWDFDLFTEKNLKIQFEYDELTELQSFDLKSLEVIMTIENK